MTEKISVDTDYQAKEAWVLGVQRKLYQQSKANPDLVWRDLWGWLTDSRTIHHAWRRISTNKGKRSAGSMGSLWSTSGSGSVSRSSSMGYGPNCTQAHID
jgi:retron-type reverse transcriptase